MLIHDNICTYTCICTCTWHTHVPCMAMHIPRTYQVQLMDMVTLMMDNIVNQAANWRLMLGGDLALILSLALALALAPALARTLAQTLARTLTRCMHADCYSRATGWWA